MPVVCHDFWAGLLVDLVGDGFVSTWCLADDSPPVCYELVVVWSFLSFWKRVDSSGDFNRGLQVERKGIIGLGLYERVMSSHSRRTKEKVNAQASR